MNALYYISNVHLGRVSSLDNLSGCGFSPHPTHHADLQQNQEEGRRNIVLSR